MRINLDGILRSCLSSRSLIDLLTLRQNKVQAKKKRIKYKSIKLIINNTQIICFIIYNIKIYEAIGTIFKMIELVF